MPSTYIHLGDYDRSAKGIASRIEWSKSSSCAIIYHYKVDGYRKLGVRVGDVPNDFEPRSVPQWFAALLDAEDEGGLRTHCTLPEKILREYGVDGVRVAWELGGNLELQVMMVKELPQQYQRRALDEVHERIARHMERERKRDRA